MLTAAKWALSIVPAGIALGALLGAAVDPDMKDAPAPWWRLTGSEQFTQADPGPEYWPQPFDAGPSYRPDLDYDAEIWALPIPAYELVILTDDPSLDLPPIEEEEVMVAEDAAEDAEAAAEDALAAQAPPAAPKPELAPGEVRKSELAKAGLY